MKEILKALYFVSTIIWILGAFVLIKYGDDSILWTGCALMCGFGMATEAIK